MGKDKQPVTELTLEAQLNLLQQQNDDLNTLLSEANAKLEVVTKEATELQESNLALAQENEQIKAAYETLQQEVELLSQQAAKAPAAPVVAPAGVSSETFELDGQKYGFVIPKLSFKGKVITAAEVLADAELQQQLVAIKSGMIKAL